MKQVLFAAAAAMFVTIAPAFAGPADDAEWDRSVYPSAGKCSFVAHQMTAQDGRTFVQRHQVCN
jgi:hypothetical protein